MTSVSDNAIDLKVHLGKEIGRLREKVRTSLLVKEIQEDSEMTEKASSIIKVLDGFREQKISEKMITKVLKIQNLVREIEN